MKVYFLSILLCLWFIFGNAQKWTETLIQFDKNEFKSFTEERQGLQLILNEAERLKNDSCLADAHRRLGILFIHQSRLDSSIFALLKSVKLAEKVKYFMSTASSNNQLGAIYSELKNRNKALFYFNKASLPTALSLLIMAWLTQV